MSYVPTGGGAEVTSTANSGIVAANNVLSSGLVAGNNITLTPDPAFGGKGLRIDSTGGGGGGVASVTSSNGSGINTIVSGANVNLTSALAAGTGIALTPSGVAKTLTVSNTQTVQPTGNGCGISTSTDVNGNTKIQTNLTAGSNITLTPSGLNTSLGIGLKPNVVIPVNGSLAVNEAALNNAMSAMEVADAPSGYFYVRNGTSGTPGQVGYYNNTGGYDNWFMSKTGNLGCATLAANTSLTVNGGPQNNIQDAMEIFDQANGYLYYNGVNGDFGRWNKTSNTSYWEVDAAGNATLNSATANTITIPSTPGTGQKFAVVDSTGDYEVFINGGGFIGGYNLGPGGGGVWNIDKTGQLSCPTVSTTTLVATGTAATGALTTTGQISTPSLNFQVGQVSMSSASGSNRIQVSAPSGPQILAYVSDIPTSAQTLEEVCTAGNAVSGPGMQFLPPTADPGIFIKCFNPNVLTFQTTSGPTPTTINLNNGGTVSLGNLFFQGGALTASSAPGSGRITVTGGPSSPQTVAYLSDITGGGGGVASVSAGSNISVTGTATNPVVNLVASPTIAGTITATGTGQFNNFTAAVCSPALQLFNNPGGSGNLGVALTTPSSGVCNMIGSDGTSACQLRVNGTSQLISGSSTTTLSTTNGNLNINNVRALVQTTGANYLSIQGLSLSGTTYALTAANFGQTVIVTLNSIGTQVITLPVISSGTVPLGSFINIARNITNGAVSGTIVVQQGFGSPGTNVTLSGPINQMATFVLTGYSGTTPLYHCVGLGL